MLFLGPDSSAHGVKFTDHKVCKSFLFGCCPHEILASTVRILLLNCLLNIHLLKLLSNSAWIWENVPRYTTWH